ncbi:MAG: CotH kinase family protein [Oscillospiraceae bacterium]|nr:CotH kinase family protein [Oscillospiraceae bacterium]
MKRSDNPPKANLLLRIVLLTALLLSLLFILVLRLRDGGEAALPPAELPSAPAAADTENTVLVLPPVETPEPAPEPTPEPERVYELPRLELNGVGPIKMDEYSRSGSLVLYDVYGNVEYEDDAFSWRTHGNSTARFGKLPVKLKLSRKADLLGMGKADKYILLANAYDKTLIRNALAFDLGAELGLDYTSQYRYVDLYISGQYRGNYMLIEAVDIGADRVNIHPAANEFLLEVFMGSYTPEGPSVTTGELGIRLEVFGDELDDTQRLWLESFLTEAEKALLSGERSAVEQYFDVDSFVDHYIINELSKNADCSFASTRFYIKDGKIYAGPLWDFDLSFGNGSQPCDWRHYVNGTDPAPTDGWYAPVLWWRPLAEQSWFEEAFAERYRALQSVIVNLYEDNELGRNRIDALTEAMPRSIEKNYTNLWSVSVRAYYGEMTSKPTYEENLEYLRSWIRERNEWILARIAEGGDIITLVPEEPTP